MSKQAAEVDWDVRARRSLTSGGQAFERLLRIAERSESGQARSVAMFIAATVGYCRFDMYCLRMVDVEISDDILACLETVRWAKAALTDLVEDGWMRAQSVSAEWGYRALPF